MAQQEEGARVVQEALRTLGDHTESTTLVAKLIQANYNDYAAVTQGIIEGQERRIAELNAELGLIRRRINELFAGDFMPNQHAIEMAVFHPNRKELKEMVEQQMDKEGNHA